MANEMKIMIDGYEDVVKNIQDMHKKSERIVNRTIGDFKTRGPSWVAQEVTKEYGISKRDVNETKKGVTKGRSQIRIKGVKLDDISIVYRGRLLTPTHFAMKPTMRPARNRPYVVSASIKRSAGRVNLGRNVFLASASKNSTTQIPWQRRSDARLPIDVIKTVSVPQMITNEGVEQNIHKRINTELGKRLEHHLKQAMK